MPYFHIGGISCNLLAVLGSGGSVICMPVFDADTFLGAILGDDLNEEPTKAHTAIKATNPSWYYAVPAIHKVRAVVLVVPQS